MRGWAPGVATTIAGSSPTRSNMFSPLELMILTPGNARPISSTKRSIPRLAMYFSFEEQNAHRQSGKAVAQ